MARRLRIQYSDAIYHVMARGNGRQDIVQDDADRGRLVACLDHAVRRSGWSLYAFVFLTNHLHLVLKTPRPNLAKGMQLFLSSYANGWARRHRHCQCVQGLRNCRKLLRHKSNRKIIESQY